jgi:predicted RNase H-like nuclease (RuvC/YqgF family)
MIVIINWFKSLMPSTEGGGQRKVLWDNAQLEVVEDDISRLRDEIWELKHRVSELEDGLRDERHERYMLGVRFRRLRKTLKTQGITMDLRTTEEE